jgi:hypothetical protein
MRDQPHDGIV